MANKLNLPAAEQYAKNFAKIICDDFFSDDDTIGGTQILNLTEIRQVNLLVVKDLFDKWELEAQKFRSPYFDFTSTEVVEALNDFKNILSRHIAIKRLEFEPLVSNAAKNAIVLLLSPESFYNTMLRDLTNFQLTKDWIRSVSKYIPTNHWILEQLDKRLGEKNYVFANEALIWLSEICQEGEEDEADKTLLLFDSVLTLPDDLETKEEAIFVDKPHEEPKVKKVLSFFDQEVADLSRTLQQNKFETQQSVEEAKPQIFEAIEETTPAPVFVEAEKIFEPEPMQVSYQEPVVMVAPAVMVEEPVAVAVEMPVVEPEPVKKQNEEPRLNEQLNQDQKTLNDQSQSNGRNTLLDYHQKSKIENIRAVISLNQRFLFINNLFHGNVEAFSHALDELEACASFAEAREVMLKKFVPRYLWDVTSAEAEEFIDIVKRRFS